MSHSWEGEAHKTSKQQHIVEAPKPPVQSMPNYLWPPFSVSLTTIQTTHTTAQASHFSGSNIFPAVYYIPQNVQPQSQPTPYMPGVIYQPMYSPMYSPTFYQMQLQPSTSQSNINNSIYNSAFQLDRNNSAPVLQQKIPTPIGSGSQFESTATFQRPPSQATSVKADMGSTSASVVNRVWIQNQRQKHHAPFYHFHKFARPSV